MDYIFVFCPQGSDAANVNLSTFPLSDLVIPQSESAGEDEPTGYQEPINYKNLTDSTKWTTTGISFEGPGGNISSSLINSGESMFLFMSTMVVNQVGNPTGNPIHSVNAYEYTLPQGETDPTQGSFGNQIVLLGTDGNMLQTNLGQLDVWGSSVCARPFGDTTSILVTCSAILDGDSQAKRVYIGLFDTTDINQETNQWQARQDLFCLSDMYFQSADYIAADWCYIAGDATPEINLLTLAQSSDLSKPCMMLVTEINVTDEGVVSLGNTYSSGVPSNVYYSDVRRDPGGRLRIWTKNPVSTPQSFEPLLAATTLPLAVGGNVQLNLIPTSDSITNTDGRYFPACVFYTFEKGKYSTTLETSTGDELSVDNYPVYEFVFYGGYLKCQVNRCGTIQVIPNAKVIEFPYPAQPTNQPTNPPPTFILGGIINGPLPIPLENYVNYIPNSPNEYHPGDLIYGIDNETINTKSVSDSWSVGFQSTGNVTKGFGVAWDISFKGGMGSVSTTSTDTSIGSSLMQPAIVSTVEDLQNPTINQTGQLLEIGVETSVTAYNYLDEFSSMGVDSTSAAPSGAAKTATVLATVSTNGLTSFVPYDVTPGVLTSYMPDAVNSVMQNLYTDPPRKTSFEGYSGTNYFGDIICRNAFPFTGQKAYLEFSWSEGGAISPKVSQINSTYQENSWTFDSSVYVGVGGGGGIDVFGFGEEFAAKFLAGVNYSHISSQSVNQLLKWGIYTNILDWGPPPRADLPSSVSQYDFRMYFLPVPTSPSTLPKIYWTQELLTYMADTVDLSHSQIDPNGGCWRIVYIVTFINYRNGKKILYDGSLDKSSVYTTSSTLSNTI